MFTLLSWIRLLADRSLLLVLGAGAGLLWANLAPESYRALVHLPLFSNPYVGAPAGASRLIDVHYLVNDGAMALFFALAGKEVWEALQPGGALHDLRGAAGPLCATLGGMLGPALVYLLGAAALGRVSELGAGWAVPCATDIAFSAFIARRVFGSAHPALPFLLLLAIADDALGLVVLALFYPVEPLQPAWLLLACGAVLAGAVLRRAGVTQIGVYLALPGALAWSGFALAGLHPALGLLPLVPVLPHATLGALARHARRPVEGILGVFGLLNAGVVLGAAGAPTWLVLAGLAIGKPCGIFAAGWLASRVLGARLPAGMTGRDLFVVGCAAGVGFTVALFVSSVAFPAGREQEAAKLGALLSVSAGLLALVAARLLGTRKQEAA